MVVRALAAFWLALACAVASAQVAIDVGPIDVIQSIQKNTVIVTTTDIDGVKSVSEETVLGPVTETKKTVGRILAPITASVIAFGRDFQPAKVDKVADGVWIISDAGTYLVVVQVPGEPVVFRPLVVAGTEKPPPVEPPTGDFAELLKVAKTELDAAPNKVAIAAWGEAWSKSLPSMEAATLDGCLRISGDVRRAVLSMHPTNGLNGFIVATEGWFTSANLDKAGYVKAVSELSKLMTTYKVQPAAMNVPINCPDGLCPVPQGQSLQPVQRGFIIRR